MNSRAILTTLSVVVVLTAGTACTLGEVGGSDPTICAQAAQHVASCMGGAAPQVDAATCTVDAAAQADQALQMSCADMGGAGERSPMFLKGLLCNLLPFLCSTNNSGPNNSGPQVGGVFRIQDCFQLPGKGWCYDMVKLGSGGACTELMEQGEWQQPQFTHSQCLQPNGGRCRLARVCQGFKDKGQCVAGLQHHNDQPVCQPGPQNPGPQNPGPQNPGPGGTCNSDANCGGQLCYEDHTCVPPHSKPAGASCKAASGAFVSAFCQAGLSCQVSVNNGQANSVCTPASNP